MVSATTPMAGTAGRAGPPLVGTRRSLGATPPGRVTWRVWVGGGREGFEGRRGRFGCAVGRPPWSPAAPVGPPPVVTGRLVPENGVVGLGAPPAGHVGRFADLDALDCLDAHQGLRHKAL